MSVHLVTPQRRHFDTRDRSISVRGDGPFSPQNEQHIESTCDYCTAGSLGEDAKPSIVENVIIVQF